ncbi:MAG: Thymidylate kinase [Candidatus Beckwithbacteria bacterium GW2011_GWB1_47_15]|uniref:Thymidylate kinase n=1 Tax=Candidatus Beckwithbacteria bacterium GW2011_GWB1_47_15 TaxID=1618371 RepID=A0A0G1U568_9BACT|nr:MAG: Thymidylate kinase [Candidatus Beckwithbacteria bacterium GW2011_GWB1_47_15]KKU70999.1 MAG: Thymidylate kinase [Candidatus Beckwithbacteria bacterium GW2011_GWA2_47_25]KKW03770.1 MAG: Thymidylate kinase [Candidatus Beckwithbacteria bacterium GW2011_GWC2_49_11]
MRKQQGKLIVFEGIDGSGKATQAKLLFNYLKKRKVAVEEIAFPRYDTIHGQVVKRMLQGEFGKSVNPYLACLPFALDRLMARDMIKNWLAQDKLVIADRYVTASMVHLSAFLPQDKQQRKFMDWVAILEYQIHGLPLENLVVLLKVPARLSQKLMVKKDMVEKDLIYQKRVYNQYQQMAKKFGHWVVVECVDKKEEILPKSEVHQRVLEALKRRKII